VRAAHTKKNQLSSRKENAWKHFVWFVWSPLWTLSLTRHGALYYNSAIFPRFKRRGSSGVIVVTFSNSGNILKQVVEAICQLIVKHFFSFLKHAWILHFSDRNAEHVFVVRAVKCSEEPCRRKSSITKAMGFRVLKVWLCSFDFLAIRSVLAKKQKATELRGSRGITRQLDAQLVLSNLALFIITRQAQGWRIILACQLPQHFLVLSQSPGGLVHGSYLLLSASFGGCFLLVWHVVSIMSSCQGYSFLDVILMF